MLKRAKLAAVALVACLITLGPALATIDGEIENAGPLNTTASTDTGLDYDVAVATDGSGNWVAVWTSGESLGGTIGTDPDILVARSIDGGLSWTDPEALNSYAVGDLSSDISPQIATDGSGNWIAVWSGTDTLGDTIDTDSDLLFARSTDNGVTWTDAAALNFNATTDNQGDRLPRIVTDRAGRWLVVWELDGRLNGVFGFDDDILSASSTDDGTSWSMPQPVNSHAATDGTNDHDNFPSLATDGKGLWVAVWKSRHPLVSPSGPIGFDDDILFARSMDDGASWSAALPLNNNAASDSGEDGSPTIAADGLGSWVAVWQSNDNLDGIGFDFDIVVSRSKDDAANWSHPAALSSRAAVEIESDFEPQVATDGLGDWIAVWRSSDALVGDAIGFDEDILVARSTNDGSGWSEPQALGDYATADDGIDRSPDVVHDGAGRWLGGWFSTANAGGSGGGDQDILFTRFVLRCDADSEPSPYGRLLFPRLCTQGTGGLGQPVFASTEIGLLREHGELYYLSADGAGFRPPVTADSVTCNAQDSGMGSYSPQPGVPPYQLDVPIAANMQPLPAPEISSLIPVGVSQVAFELVSSLGSIYGNTAVYFVRDCGLWVDEMTGGPTMLHFVSHDVQVGGAPADLDVVSGSLSELRADRTVGSAVCLGEFGDTTRATDVRPTPPGGDGYYYLLRGACSDPTFGSSSLTPDLRDALQGSSVCP